MQALFTLAAAAAVVSSAAAPAPAAAPTSGGAPQKLSFSHVRTATLADSDSGSGSGAAKLPYTVLSSTYLSIPLDLAPGEMVFTNTGSTRLAMPDARGAGYAITGFSGEIVDEFNNSAPLSDIYDHHWIAVQAGHKNALCGGSPEYIVGIGAESRHTPAQYPAGYGYVVTAKQNVWGANIHLLHTQGLAGTDQYRATKECNECYYSPNKGPTCTLDQNGTFECCGQDCPDHTCFCATAPDATTATSRYYLRYQVNYTYDLDAITPVDVAVFTAPNCAAFYSVFENNDQPEDLQSHTVVSPADVDVVFAVGHQHVGSINISLFVNDVFVCASYPRYGTTEGKAGDEYGYLVEMSRCIDKDTTGSYFVAKGDRLRLDSYYWAGSEDARIAPHPGGTHLNAMAYMYLAYTLSTDPTQVSDTADDCSWWNC